jgi:peptide deformylase
MKIITNKQFLNRKSKSVKFEEGLRIGNTLLNILSDYPDGVGLAAPQIGLLKRVFVIRFKNYEGIFINPGLLYEENSLLSSESCLSFPNKTCNVVRYNKILIMNQIEEFRDATLQLQNSIAIIWQHEFDHLNGITILDKDISDKKGISNDI